MAHLFQFHPLFLVYLRRIGKFWGLLWLSSQVFPSIDPLIFPQPSLATDNSLASPEKATLLTLTDLPPGFEVAPPILQQLIAGAIAQTRGDLQKADIDLEETVLFLDIENAVIVAYVKMYLTNIHARATFDNHLRGEGAKELFLSGFRQITQFFGKATIAEPQAIASLQGLGETAFGYRLEATIENFSPQIFADSLLFRRRETVILLIVGSISRSERVATASVPERLDIRNLAEKIDRRLQAK
jgi:hypothetical protein